MVLIGRSSVGGSCEISVRDLFCFLSVFCDPGSQLSPCFTDIYLFALAAWTFVHHSSLFVLLNFVLRVNLNLSEGGLRFNHSGYPVFGEYALYFLHE